MIQLQPISVVLLMTAWVTTLLSKASCPFSCICSYDSFHVNCSHQNLKKSYIWTGANQIQSLDYSNNHVQYLEILEYYDLIKLDLSNNIIKYITKDTFKFLLKLQHLDLHMNLLTDIDSDTFKNLHNLKVLNLHSNYISQVPDYLFWTLDNLQILDMASNKFESFKAKIKSQNFKILQLSYNNLGYINSEMMESLQNSSLELLNITATKIVQLEPSAFRYLRNLKTLIADSVDFYVALNISRVIQYLYLSTLHLNNIKLQFKNINSTYILQNINSSTLTEIQFKYNSIQNFNQQTNLSDLTDMQFKLCPTIPNLKKFSLKGQNLLSINLDFFELLQHLEILDLSHNKIVYIRQINNSNSLQNLKELDLSYNSIHSLGDFKTYSPFPGIKVGMMELPNLTKLYLNNNRINRVYKSCFRSNTTEMDFQNNTTMKKTKHPNALEILDLSENELFKLDKEFFDAIPNLRILNLTGNQFGKVLSNGILKELFFSLRNLQWLNFSRNIITQIPIGQFENQANLKVLDLSSNALSTIDYRVLAPLKKLSELYLQNNYFTIIDYPIQNYFKNKQLISISHNPFQCDCQIFNFSQWLQSTHNIPDKKSNYYMCNDSMISLLEITYDLACNSEFESKDLIKQKQTFNMPLALSLLVVLPLFFIIGIAAFGYYYRWYLRYWYHKIHMHIKIFTGSSPTSSMSKDYDAFVSYSSKDYEWVCLVLRPKLEENASFKLCIHDRDFKLGYQITDNIVDSIESSRKIMLILSKNYIQSEWCKWEMEIARFQDNLILVFLENIPKNSMPPTLRFLARSRTYIEWKSDSQAQKLFWERVIAALHISRTL